jgi:DNA-binding NarL/FixJ family response regulator
MGMLGYIIKATPLPVFRQALESFLRGLSTFPILSRDKPSQIRLTRRQQQLMTLLQGGLSSKEIAECLGVTDRTVRRDWEKARALLSAALQ